MIGLWQHSHEKTRKTFNAKYIWHVVFYKNNEDELRKAAESKTVVIYENAEGHKAFTE
jgi:hypothetical protein